MTAYRNTKLGNVLKVLVMVAILATILFQAVSPALAQSTQPQPPYPLVAAQEEKGRTVQILQGFDPQEYGGNDSDCTLEGNPDVARLGEEVGSPREACKTIVEWSLKNGDTTIASGFFAMEPYIWFRFEPPFESTNGNVRFVGSFWRVPRGWNAHMLAMDYAADWQEKNPGLLTVVGLSPKDKWVQDLWKDAESKYENGASTAVSGAQAPKTGSTPAPTTAPTAGAQAPTQTYNGPTFNEAAIQGCRVEKKAKFSFNGKDDWDCQTFKVVWDDAYNKGTDPFAWFAPIWYTALALVGTALFTAILLLVAAIAFGIWAAVLAHKTWHRWWANVLAFLVAFLVTMFFFPPLGGLIVLAILIAWQVDRRRPYINRTWNRMFHPAPAPTPTPTPTPTPAVLPIDVQTDDAAAQTAYNEYKAAVSAANTARLNLAAAPADPGLIAAKNTAETNEVTKRTAWEAARDRANTTRGRYPGVPNFVPVP